jgi:hypothetical protein
MYAHHSEIFLSEPNCDAATDRDILRLHIIGQKASISSSSPRPDCLLLACACNEMHPPACKCINVCTYIHTYIPHIRNNADRTILGAKWMSVDKL